VKTIGVLSTALTAVALAAGLLLGARMLPELRRYMQIRNM